METQIVNTIIMLESDIIQILWKDNTRCNTFHFVWDEDTEAISLELVTHNTRNTQNFLLKRTTGISKEECLKKMLDYVEETHKQEYNWTVFWTDAKGEEHKSYFRGVDEDEVRRKFNYEDHKATITEIRISPLS